MAIEGSTIAAILTGVLALAGALVTAWMSGWNDERIQARKSRKVLARFSVPLLIAAWDLANWFNDILGDKAYSPQRCKAYGNEWDNDFTSYLIGQYFASVHVVREMTQFFAHLKDRRAHKLKKLLWKIQDEFISMHYEGRESLEMRWFEGDILAAQERLTTTDDGNGDENTKDMRVIGWVEFQDLYYADGSEEPSDLKDLFGEYETQFQLVIYRRFKHLYSTTWKNETNPQGSEKLLGISEEDMEKLIDEWKTNRDRQLFEGLETETSEEEIKRILEEEVCIRKEKEKDPNVGIVIPDHRFRRIQHLLCNLVELLDDVSSMRFNRPVRRCSMEIKTRVIAPGNPLGLVEENRVPCDCGFKGCEQEDFDHRDLPPKGGLKGLWSSYKRKRSGGSEESTLRRKDTEKFGGSPC